MSTMNRRHFQSSALLFSCLLSVGSAKVDADVELRWKLKAGDALTYRIEQETQTETAGTGKAMRVGLDTSMTVEWKVTAVDEQQVATISQTVRDFQMTMQADKQDPIVFDSRNKTPPGGLARELADSAKPFLDVPIQIRLSNRAEVIDVILPEALKASGEATAGKAPAGSPEALVAFLRQVSVTLPEKPVAENAPWDLQREVRSPVGLIQLDRQVRYSGSEEVEGNVLEKLQFQGTITAKSLSDRDARIKEGTQNGTIWFDAKQGRLTSAEVAQKLVTERPYRDMTIKVQSTSTLKMQLVK